MGIKRHTSCAGRGFTLIEVLVVVAIIALLIAILLPSLNLARENARASVCGTNQRQMCMAASAYTTANQDWLNPIEDWWFDETGAKVEVTFRVLLYPYMGRTAQAFDCPAERRFIYSDGFSEDDEQRTLAMGGPALEPNTDRAHLFGVRHPLERWNFGGIGVAGVHWLGKKQLGYPTSMPFGRTIETGYVDGLRRFSQLKSPGRVIWYSDGAGFEGEVPKYGDDLGWWIRPQATDGSQCNPGFNRFLDNNYGCQRHNKRANYGFADGHVSKLDANNIPCNVNECWWSYRPEYHRIALPG